MLKKTKVVKNECYICEISTQRQAKAIYDAFANVYNPIIHKMTPLSTAVILIIGQYASLEIVYTHLPYPSLFKSIPTTPAVSTALELFWFEGRPGYQGVAHYTRFDPEYFEWGDTSTTSVVFHVNADWVWTIKDMTANFWDQLIIHESYN